MAGDFWRLLETSEDFGRPFPRFHSLLCPLPLMPTPSYGHSLLLHSICMSTPSYAHSLLCPLPLMPLDLYAHSLLYPLPLMPLDLYATPSVCDSKLMRQAFFFQSRRRRQRLVSHSTPSYAHSLLCSLDLYATRSVCDSLCMRLQAYATPIYSGTLAIPTRPCPSLSLRRLPMFSRPSVFQDVAP